MSTNLRSDITGLRAIAVLAVTIFHIGHIFDDSIIALPGGFLGVDIFFVISGFLMTKIIFKGLENNSFSLWDFYKKRAKRICPALFVVVLITTIIGYFTFNAEAYHRLTREAEVSLGFISNFRFAKETGYFDSGDLSHLFLHTWSLSIEWQFYIFYPILLLLIKKFLASNKAPYICSALVILSLISGIVWTEFDPLKSYYMLPSRASELLVGSLAYFCPLSAIFKSLFKQKDLSTYSPFCSKYLEALGLLILCISFAVVDDKNGWPTAWMLLPMLGTWLCIASNNQNSLLRNVVFQKIGLWSYALYLVHWPVLVLAYIFGFHDNLIALTVIIFLLSVALHYTVEKRRNYGYGFLILYLCCVFIVYLSDIYRPSYKVKSEIIETYEKIGGDGFKIDLALLVNSRKPMLLIQGDSFAHETVSALAARNIPFIVNANSGCFSIAGYYSDHWEKKNCNLLYKMTKSLSDYYPKAPIVFIQNWSLYQTVNKYPGAKIKDKLISTEDESITVDISNYKELLFNSILKVAYDFKGRKVFILGDKQSMSSELALFIKTCNSEVIDILPKLYLSQTEYIHKHINEVLKDAVNHVSALRKTDNSLAEIVYIEPYNYCSEGKCDLFINGLSIYSDEIHYSWAGSEKPVTHMLEKMGMDPGNEITDFSKLPDIDFSKVQTVLEYSEESGFKFPEEK